MNGKKDTVAIFESYKQVLKEQDENTESAEFIMGKVIDAIYADNSTLNPITPEQREKLQQFLTDPKTIAAFKAFQASPLKMQQSPVDSTSSLGQGATDASAVNMGKGGVLEVQPDGQYPR